LLSISLSLVTFCISRYFSFPSLSLPKLNNQSGYIPSSPVDKYFILVLELTTLRLRDVQKWPCLNQKQGQCCCLLQTRLGGGEILERRRGVGTMRNIEWRGWPSALVVMWHAPLVRAVYTWKRSATADLAVTATCSSHCQYSASSSARWPPTSLVSLRRQFPLPAICMNVTKLRARRHKEHK
jgi:hypothetical protein